MDKLKPKQDSQSLYMSYFLVILLIWSWNSINQGVESSQIQELCCYVRNKFPAWLSSEIKILAYKCNCEMLILLKQRPLFKAYLSVTLKVILQYLQGRKNTLPITMPKKKKILPVKNCSIPIVVQYDSIPMWNHYPWKILQNFLTIKFSTAVYWQLNEI